MAHAQYYPPADATTQNFYATYPALFTNDRFMSDVNVLVLHTTEGTSWPGYKSGSETPTLTYDPRSHQMRQHIPVNMAGRALVQGAGVTTNRNNCAQIEIIGYAALGGPLDAQAVNDLGALLAWLHTEWSVPIAAPYLFAAAGYHRMTDAEWSAFKGVCGHQHVPQNVHWDPGDMNVQAILNAATVRLGGNPGGIGSGGVVIPGTPTWPNPTNPTTTQEDDDMKAFLKAPGSTDVFVSDGVTAWKVADATALANYAELVREGLLNIKQPAPGSTGAVFYPGTGVYVREVPANLIGKVVA